MRSALDLAQEAIPSDHPLEEIPRDTPGHVVLSVPHHVKLELVKATRERAGSLKALRELSTHNPAHASKFTIHSLFTLFTVMYTNGFKL
jgi:hypothetical protein